LFDLALSDKNVVLLTADLGFKIFERFEALSGQFFNVGISEQNMIGLASGLALLGKKIVVYSIGNFPTLRCLEQIRNDACYHNLNITIVSAGGGFSYGALGMSHHATEDIAIMRALPNVTVIAPSTTDEARKAITQLVKAEGVSYLRLDKTSAESMYIEDNFVIGKARRYREGSDITLITTGGILYDVNIAADELKKIGISARVIGMHSIKPIDKEEIIDAAINTGGIVSIEEHNMDGGLGSAISEVCMDQGVIPKIFSRIGLNDTYSSMVGSQQYLKSQYKMDSVAIVKEVKNRLNL